MNKNDLGLGTDEASHLAGILRVLGD